MTSILKIAEKWIREVTNKNHPEDASIPLEEFDCIKFARHLDSKYELVEKGQSEEEKNVSLNMLLNFIEVVKNNPEALKEKGPEVEKKELCDGNCTICDDHVEVKPCDHDHLFGVNQGAVCRKCGQLVPDPTQPRQCEHLPCKKLGCIADEPLNKKSE